MIDLLSILQETLSPVSASGIPDITQAISTIGGVIYLVVRDQKQKQTPNAYTPEDRARSEAVATNVEGLCRKEKIQPVEPP